MYVFCKSCKNDVEAKVDKNTLKNKQATNDTKALCGECGDELNLTIYTIKSLVSMNQFYEKPKAEAAFSFHCESCGKTEGAKLSSDKKSANCGHCGEKLNISEYMIKAMGIAKSSSIDSLG